MDKMWLNAYNERGDNKSTERASAHPLHCEDATLPDARRQLRVQYSFNEYIKKMSGRRYTHQNKIKKESCRGRVCVGAGGGDFLDYLVMFS